MTERYDLVVVGGGIHGVGVAQAAACAGYSVMLLEQAALAAGSSSRSSKLIHGGLRYLEHHDFGLVRENLKERETLLRIAPDLVHLAPFHIPVYAQTSRRPATLYLGLTLYALLAGLRRDGRFASVPRRDWERLDGLEIRGLQQVVRYYDAQTDDAALTRAVMRSAMDLGAELIQPAEFAGARIEPTRCEVRYRVAAGERECSAAALVNAAGPWAAGVDARITPRPAPVAVDLVQGSHLVLGDPLQRGCYCLEAPQDRRVVFLMPWGEGSLLGTTEHGYTGDPAEVVVLDVEQAYLLEVLRHYFPRHPARVVGRFAGLRVLPKSAGTAFRRTRETRLVADHPAMPRRLSIYGGKLTGYRATGEKVIRMLHATLPPRRRRAHTALVPLRPVD